VKVRFLVGMSARELERLCEELGFESYRGRQLSRWIYEKGALTFDEMTDLPLSLRERLKGVASITPLEVADVRVSRDGTTKYLHRLPDGETVEAVFIPHRDWETICVSTQVGCPIGCVFCASGRDFVRNLTAGEIVAQVLMARKSEGTNVVFMGIGEPLLNRRALFKALELLNREARIGARRMTISTVGIVEGIRELAKLGMQVNLAVSLHAPDDELRRRLVPAALPPIKEVIEACHEYFEATKRRVSFEYVLLNKVNDSEEHAEALADLLLGLNCHVNLIPYNEAVPEFERPPQKRVERFKRVLERMGVKVTVRRERGSDIEAACGQLRRRALKAS